MSVLKAYLRAARSLLLPGVLWHFLWPAVLAVLLWGLGLYWGLVPATEGIKALIGELPRLGPWLAQGFGGAATGWLLSLLLVLLAGFMAFVFAILLVAVVSLPMMLDTVARTEYADVEMRRGGSLWGSGWNAVSALILLLVVGFICLPLLFVPGCGVIVMLGLSTWFNQRCFRYDALMNHADAAELRRIPARRRLALYGLGLTGALLCFVPVLNLLSPALSGLAFTHYLLAALREERSMG